MIEKNIIIHIGPYKTGTTSIQTNLMAYRERLEEHGYMYSPDYGIADYLLAKELGSKNFRHINHKDWWLGVEPVPTHLDAANSINGEILHRIYSCETFCDGDFDSLRRWADGIKYAQCNIVAAIREPRSWMISSYFQEARYRDVDFDAYVAEHLESKKYFLSKLFALWDLPKSKFRIITYRRATDIWMDFCRVTNLGTDFESIPRNNSNVSPNIIESLYYAFMPSYVPRYFSSMHDWSPNISEGRFRRTLLDISVVARPIHEWVRQWTEEDFLQKDILTRRLNPILEEYREAWLDDAERFAHSENISKGDLLFVRQALNEYREQGSESCIVPVEGFKNKLPIDANFEVIMRLVSVAIGMRCQGLDYGKLYR